MSTLPSSQRDVRPLREALVPRASVAESEELIRVATFMLLGLGSAARIWLFLHDRSLYNDEAAVALNLMRRGWIGVLGPLDIYQTAAPLFLWIEKAIGQITGWSTLGLRMLPAAASIAALAVMTWTAGRIGGWRAAMWAAAIGAAAPVLLWYTVELKPYSIDALAAVALLAVVLSDESTADNPATLRAMSVAAVIAVLMSQAVVFVAAGLTVVVLLRSRRRGELTIRKAALLAVPWVVAFLAAYFSAYDDPTIRAYMQWFYWGDAPTRPSLAARELFATGLHAIVTAQLVPDSGWQPHGYVVLAVMLWSLVFAYRALGYWKTVALLTGPTALLVAGAIHLFPLTPRLMLVGTPSVVILLGVGLARIRGPAMLHAGLAMTAAIPGILLFPATSWSASLPDGFDALTSEIRRDTMLSPVYVAPRGGAVFAYILEREPEPASTVRNEVFAWIRPGGPGFENASERSEVAGPLAVAWDSRLWLLGRASGLAFNAVRGFTDASVDDWAAGEVRSLATAAGNGWAWVLIHKRVTPDTDALLRAIKQRGGHVTAFTTAGKDALVRVRFD
jgi:hypothetical protein